MSKVERLRENLKWHGRTGWLNTADITEALDEQDAEIASLKVDADRYRAMRAQLPQDGSRGQMDAWNDMRVEIVELLAQIDELKRKLDS